MWCARLPKNCRLVLLGRRAGPETSSSQRYRRCTQPSHVRTHIRLLVVIPAIVLTVACAGGADVPTGPSDVTATPAATPGQAVDFPSLTGRWRVSGSMVFRNQDNGNVLTWGNCSGAFTVATQNRGTFTGPFSTQGGGWNSDRFCTASGTLTGELTAPDRNAARARSEGNFQNWPRPSVSPSCETASAGDGVWTGTATSDAIRLQLSDVLRCPVNVDGGLPGMPMANFERTVTLTFERW